MIALLARYTPAPVKARLRGKGRHRRPGRPMLVDYRVTPGFSVAYDQLEFKSGWEEKARAALAALRGAS